MRHTYLAAAALVLVTAAPMAAAESTPPAQLAAVRVTAAYTQHMPGNVVGIRSRTQRTLEGLGRALSYFIAQKYNEDR
jgi:hypothetical protein